MATDADLISRLSTLHEIMRALAAEPDSARLQEAATQGARKLFDAPGALVIARSEDRHVLVVEAVAGTAPAEAPAWAARVFAEGRAVADDGHAGAPPGMAAAIAGDTRPERALVVLLAPGARPGPGDLAMLAVLAEHLAITLRQAHTAAGVARRVARVEEHAAALRRIGEAHQRDAVIERTLDVATTLIGADRAAVYLLGAREEVTAVWARRLSRHYLTQVAQLYRSSAGGMLFRVGAPLYVADLGSDPRTRVLHDAIRQEGLRSALLVPLVNRGRVIGALALYHDIPWVYDAEDLALVRSFADQVALSLAEAALYEEHDGRLRQLRLLQALVAAATEGREAVDALERCQRALAALVVGGLPAAWLYRREAGQLRCVAQAGAVAFDVRVSEEAARAALAVRRALTHVSPDAPPLSAAPLGPEPVGALVVAPPPAPVPQLRSGTLHVAVVRDEHWADLDLFVATAAAQLYTLLQRPAEAAPAVPVTPVTPPASGAHS
jgi:GAF domain-containing protein